MAYGINAPFGLQPREYLTGGTWSGQLSEYLINPAYATQLYTGDPVAFQNDGTIGIGVPGASIIGVFFGCKYITAAGGGGQGNPAFSPYWPGNLAGTIQPNTQVTALIVDDPNVLFDIQASNSNPTGLASTALQLGITQTNLNQNANFAIGGTAFTDFTTIPPNNPVSGSIISGQSGYYLDVSTISSTSNSNLKIIRLTPNVATSQQFYTSPGNVGGITQVGGNFVYSNGAFNNVIVAINNDIYKGGTGNVGGQLLTATGNLTAANINGMNAAPVQILAAPGAGLAIAVNSFTISMATLGTAYAAGGNSGLEYGNTVALGGTKATTTQPAARFTSNDASPIVYAGNVVNLTAVANQGIFISNDTAAFTTGTSTYTYTINYSVIPV